MSKGKLTNLTGVVNKFIKAEKKRNPRFAAWIDKYKKEKEIGVYRKWIGLLKTGMYDALVVLLFCYAVGSIAMYLSFTINT